MFKKLNESFDKKYFIEADTSNNVTNDKPKYIQDMEKQLHELAITKLSQGISNIKDFEYGFQSIIEAFFPDNSWWEVTDCNIFWTLFETKDVDETIDEIIEGIKPEFLKDDVIERAESKKTDLEAEADVNTREAEFGADGTKVFRDPKNESLKEDVNEFDELSKNDNVRETYMKYYPDDELGLKIEPSITFVDVLQRMKNKEDFYDIIGYGDSIIRERIFDLMSKIYDADYDYFYYLWLGKDAYNNFFMESVSKNKRVDESADEEEPYSYKQMYDDLKLNGVFDKEKGSFSVMFREEAEHCKKILKRAGYDFEVSGDDGVVPQWFHFEYWKKPLKEDTVKRGNYWVNKGKEGTHGKFRTKKQADAQRKAMFANGYQENLGEGWADNYASGTVDVGGNRYYYEVKVFEEPSQFGIDKGNISKLYVKRLNDGDVVAHYDRGWDMEPINADAKEVVEIIKKKYPVTEGLSEDLSESIADKYYDKISEEEFAEILGFDSVEEFREDDYMEEAAENYDVKRVAFLRAKPEYFDDLDNDGYAFVDLVSDGEKEFIGFYAGGRLYEIEDEIREIVGD